MSVKGHTYSLDSFKSVKGKCVVVLMDHTLNKLIERVGDVRMIGNFSPTWISLEGVKVLVPDHYAMRFIVDSSATGGKRFTL